MWPWGHLAVGYFLYSPFARARFGRPPTDRATLWLAVGTQLPDLVDKPLAWRLGVLPAARTLGHSLLTITVVSMLVYAYFERRDRAHVALAFGVGYVTHPLVDGLFPLLNGQYQYAAYLLWPLFGLSGLPAYDIGSLAGIVLVEPLELLLGGAEPIDFDIAVSGLLEITVVVLAGRMWHHDGVPGVALFRDRLGLARESDSDPDPKR